MPDRHDILHGSRAWDRLQDGIPEAVQPKELRDWMHAMASVLTVMVAYQNDALDQIREGDLRDIELSQETGSLERRVFDGETGIVTTLRTEFRNANKWVLAAVVGGLVAIIGTLSTLLIATQGAGS